MSEDHTDNLKKARAGLIEQPAPSTGSSTGRPVTRRVGALPLKSAAVLPSGCGGIR
jgi:hypothetical protein